MQEPTHTGGGSPLKVLGQSGGVGEPRVGAAPSPMRRAGDAKTQASAAEGGSV